MSNSERICYTLTGYCCTEMSKGRGSIEYLLMDEFGNERTVTAIANINMFKKVNSIRPIYMRELPLIQALSKVKLNDKVIVDFTEFNKTHKRGSTRKPKISTPSVKAKKSESAQIYDFASLLDNKMRFAQLMVISVSGFITVTYLLSLV